MAFKRILLRRDTAALWTSGNPTLASGEIGYESNTGKYKIGDGSTAWTSLSYSNTNLPDASINDLGDVTITSASDGDFLRWNGASWINDAVNLSTDTIGSYVQSLVAGTGVTLTNNTGEGATPTVAVDTATIAPIASPTFTGVPAAPTATASTNTTQLATTAFVRTEVAALVAAAPASLDTLNELALALGSDAAFSTTVTNSLALKAPLASPALTGTPTAPTADALTNTTQLATTAFVTDAAAAVAATGAADAILEALIDAKGDLIVGTANGTPAILTVGTDGYFLKANSGALTGVEWGAIPMVSILDDVGDVTLTAIASGEFLKWNGSAWINSAVDLSVKADLSSPIFTGVPEAPTASSGTNTTQLATTAFATTVSRDVLVRLYMEVI